MPGNNIYTRHANRHILLRRTFPNHVISSVPVEWYSISEASSTVAVPQNQTIPQPISPVNALLLAAGSAFLARKAARKYQSPGTARGSGLAFEALTPKQAKSVKAPLAQPSIMHQVTTLKFSGTPVGRVSNLLEGGGRSRGGAGFQRNLSRVAGRSLAGAGGLVVFGLAKAFF